MTDKTELDALVKRLRRADEYEPLGHDGWEAADRIEAMTAENKRLSQQCEGLMRAGMNNGQALILAEAKLAKAVRGLNAICVWGEDTYARDMARTTLAEIEGEKG